MEITIAVHDKTDFSPKEETNDQYWNRLNKSIKDIEDGKGVTFSIGELEAFIQ
jgi:hypothetical protein